MKILAVTLLVAVALILPTVASAAFIGAYAIENWDQVLTGDPPGGGTMWGEPDWLPGVDLTLAPDSIVLMTGNQGCSSDEPCTTQFVLRDGIPETGFISFEWSFLAMFDPFGFMLGDTFHQLTDDNGGNEQSGVVSNLFVEQGQFFAFVLNCNACDWYPSMAEVWNFNFNGPEAEVPEPTTLALIGIGIAGFALRFRRRRQA